MFMSVDLPAPFWPISPSTRPRAERERHIADGVDAGEGLGDIFELEDRFAHAAPSLARSRVRATSSAAAARMIPPFTTSM